MRLMYYILFWLLPFASPTSLASCHQPTMYALMVHVMYGALLGII